MSLPNRSITSHFIYSRQRYLNQIPYFILLLFTLLFLVSYNALYQLNFVSILIMLGVYRNHYFFLSSSLSFYLSFFLSISLHAVLIIESHTNLNVDLNREAQNTERKGILRTLTDHLLFTSSACYCEISSQCQLLFRILT